MQSVCALLPVDYARRVVDLRAQLSLDPALGALYDPPFVHFTLQLAEEYDWAGLDGALAKFAASRPAFPLATVGLLAFTGSSTAITIAPVKDRAVAEFQAAVWEVVTPFAQGRVDPFYHPDRWVPHITIKRGGTPSPAFGWAMGHLASEDLREQLTIDNVAVQHDPGHNSQTHYLRLRYPLGRSVADTAPPAMATNATLQEFVEEPTADGSRQWRATIQPDQGAAVSQVWSCPTVVQLTAAAQASPVYFPGARCRLDSSGTVVAVDPATPFPVAVNPGDH
jgi:2'-5' RNA ligase